MSKAFIKILITFLIAGCFIKPVFAGAESKQIEQIKSQNLDKETELYKIAEVELDKNIYRLYRISERIIRANNLSEYPWVIDIKYSEEYDINASASQGNLVTLNYAVINTFSDDVSAIAFIVAHEMAHSVKKHIAKGQRKIDYLKKQLEDAIKRYEQNTDNHIKNYSVLQRIIGLGLPHHTTEELEKERKKIEKLQEELNQELANLSRKNEYEADRTAAKYLVKAGFDPKGGNRVMEFLSRFENYDKGDKKVSHPVPKNRIWQINNEIKSMDINSLKLEGDKAIKNSKPLTYKKINRYKYKHITQKTLIINSKYGTNQNKNDPFVKMFGK